MPDFKFQIGDVLCHKADPSKRLRFVVLEQCTGTCSGGTQLSYLLAGCFTDGQTAGIHAERSRLMEVELEPAPPEPPRDRLESLEAMVRLLQGDMLRMSREPRRAAAPPAGAQTPPAPA